MAKRKKPPEVEIVTDVDEAAYVIVCFLAIVNPQVNIDRALPLVVEMLEEGLRPDNLEMYGQAIRATAHETTQTH